MTLMCPKCKSKNVEWIDTNHHEILVEDENGYTDAICFCRDCKISFALWIDFDLSNIRVQVDDIWQEDIDDEE